MIEVPRGAITADEIAKEADFFSFGTNDLTQLTYGFSRDDIGKFLGAYQERRILARDQAFASLDAIEGVGALVEMGTKKGRAGSNRTSRSASVVSTAATPASIFFFDHVGFDYVSCLEPLPRNARGAC